MQFHNIIKKFYHMCMCVCLCVLAHTDSQWSIIPVLLFSKSSSVSVKMYVWNYKHTDQVTSQPGEHRCSYCSMQQTPIRQPLLQETLGKPAPERLNQSGRDDEVAVTSAALYGNHLHLAPDRWPCHSIFYRPDALPDAQPTVSKHWRPFTDCR